MRRHKKCRNAEIRSTSLFAFLGFLWLNLYPVFLPEEQGLIRSQQMSLMLEIPILYSLNLIASVALAAELLNMLFGQRAFVIVGRCRRSPSLSAHKGKRRQSPHMELEGEQIPSEQYTE